MKVRFLSFVMAVLSLCTGCMGEDSFAEENARLEVDELLVLDGMKNSVEFTVTSNRSWSLIIDESCDWLDTDIEEHVNLSKMTQKTTVVLHADENESEQERTAICYVLVGKEHYSDIIVRQKIRGDFVEIEIPQVPDPEDFPRMVDPSVFSSLGGTRTFNIISRSDWTARVSEESTAEGISISTTSGSGDQEGFAVTVSGINTDMENSRSVIIEFIPKGGEVVKYEMTQQKGSIMAIEPRDMNNTVSVWPFENEQVDGNMAEGSLKIGEYLFPYYCSNYNCLNKNGGWQLGTGADNFIGFPAIEGWRLSRISFYECNGTSAPYVADEKGNIVYPSISYKEKTRVDIKLSDTAAGTSYRLYIGNDKTFKFWWVEIEYTKS